MNIIDLLIQFGFITAPQILLLVIIGFWGKRLIEYFFSKTIELKKNELAQNLENHKQKIEHENKSLQHDLNKNFEIYRNRLEILRLEFQIKFAELHVKRSEIIVNIYKLLTELNSSMLDLTAPIRFVQNNNNAENEEQKRAERANNSIKEFSNYYIQHKIYFSKGVVVKLDIIVESIKNIVLEFNYYKDLLKDDKDKSWKELYEGLKEINIKVNKEITLALADLENEFRDLLGVNSQIVNNT